MKQFEYFSIDNPTFMQNNALNAIGKDGWELISHCIAVLPDGYRSHYYTFKREITQNILKG